ncbi:MAG: late competence protein ComER [Bacillus sp. (in: firmicutes)]
MIVGIIGTGNMGSILADALLQSHTIKPSHLKVYNRTKDKAIALQKQYPDIEVGESILQLAQDCHIIFVCVKPGDMHPLFTEIGKTLTKDKCVVSITSPISTQQMESVLSCSTARFIPSITNKVLSGVSLLSFGNACSEDWKRYIRALAQNISEGIEINNDITRVASDIVSCGPAFFSYLAQAFIDSATAKTGIDEKTATLLTEKMLIGFGDLLKSGHYSLPSLQEKVCVKGGITGEGIKVLEAELGNIFDHLFEATHQKFKEEITKIEQQFQQPY